MDTQKLRAKIERKLKRAESKEAAYKADESSLSKWGYQAFGYSQGRASALDEVLGMLDEMEKDNNVH